MINVAAACLITRLGARSRERVGVGVGSGLYCDTFNESNRNYSRSYVDLNHFT